MADYFPISPRFWATAKAEGWSDPECLFALYTLTCPHRNLEGLYKLPKAYIADDLEWRPAKVRATMHQLQEREFCDYDEETQVIFIRKALKYQAPISETQIKGAVKALNLVPDTHLLSDLYRAAEQYAVEFAKKIQDRVQTVEDALARRVTDTLSDTASIQTSSSSNTNSISNGMPTASAPAPRRKRSPDKAQVLAKEHLQALQPVIGAGNAFDLLHEFRSIWNVAWQDAIKREINPKAVGIQLLGAFIATVTDSEPDYGRAGKLVGRYGKLALLGIDEGLMRDVDDPYTYAAAVCKTQAELRRAEVDA